MASAGTVSIEVAAQTAKLVAEVKKVRSELKTLKADVSGVRETFENASKLLLSGAALTGFAMWVKNAADAAENFSLMAERLDVTTRELQAFRFAALDANIQFDTLTNTLTEANKRLVDASLGTGQAAKWIERLGLNVGELRQLSPTELFLEYSEAVNQLSLRSDQLAAAQGLLGKQSREVFNLFLDAPGAISDANRELERFGLAMSDVEYEQIKAANYEFDKLAFASEVAGQKVAATLAPYVTQLARDFFDATVGAKDLRTVIHELVTSGVVGFGVLANGWKTFDAVVSGILAGITSAAAPLAGMLARLREIQADRLALLGFQGIAQSQAESAQRLRETQKLLDAITENAIERSVKAAEGIKRIAELKAEADAFIADAQESAARAMMDPAGGGGPGGALLSDQVSSASFGIDPAAMAGVLDSAVLDQLRADKDALAALDEGYREAAIELERQHAEQKYEIWREELDRRRELLLTRAEDEGKFYERQADLAVGALIFLAGKTKTIGAALAAVEKAQQLRTVYRDTAVAAQKAIAIYGPTPWGFAAAAAAVAFGGLQAKAILSDGAPSGGGSSVSAPASSREFDEGSEQRFGATGGRVAQVVIEGNIFSSRETADWIIDEVSKRINTGDRVLIDGGSRQAAEIRG